MLDAGRSTERLHKGNLSSGEDGGVTKKKKGGIRPIWYWIAGAIVILAIAGAVVGALIAKGVIDTGSRKSAVAVGGATETGGSPSETSSPSVEGADGSDSSVDTPSSSSASATGTATSSTTSGKSTSKPTATACTTSDKIPSKAKDTWMDTTSWLDLAGFNCTFTDETVGGLPIVGLNSTWDGSKQANANVPVLNKPWGSYASKPFRGVSLGGWLSLEPFITPSLFPDTSIVDEYSLCKKLGPKEAAKTLEKHYSTFITEDDFKAIAAAGLDHVRIPFSYWAVKTYDDDPYVQGISWRYLLRGIEWARAHGLRVKLDLHGAPGSQNGWNHSGRQGKVDWISGLDGATNAQRTLDIHVQLAKFFSQDRYKDIIAFYGLINEPALALSQSDLVAWTEKAFKVVKDNGFSGTQVFSESMRGLEPWQGSLTGYGDKLAIDVHQYTIFDNTLTGLKHTERVNFACKGWTDAISAGMNTATGFGPTMVGEWSQADTDCIKYLNGVGNGARWTGTFSGTSTPYCPTKDSKCSCDLANADAASFSKEYKLFLLTWAEAQMSAFEKSWGWFYWTWKTESAPQWSYQAGLAGGFMPPLAYKRDWDCSKPVPDFGSLPEFY
ncbi:hypothetical protein V500_10922 [Pseudogymnoascus sp. VKM F-4518 (FW-2643)]|nr:hypothetical protein V500_10922 [Pseudogymnoascus sp. VKM F-4518 (FW-2643)]